MSQKIFSICNIIAEKEEDYKTLLEYLGNYPVSISKTFPDELYFSVPTLVIGWNFIKNKFPKQNILNKTIDKKLFWSFSKSEDEKEFQRETESFFIKSVKEWLPHNFKLFDSYINQESLDLFLKENINKDKKLFVFFHEGALYIYNDNKNFIINIKSLSTIYSNFRELITDILNKHETIAFSYNNFSGYVDFDKIGDVITIDSLRWVKYGVETPESYFNIIPNFSIHKYIPFLMSKLNSIELDYEEKLFYKRMCQRDKITCWLSSREVAFIPEFDNKKLDFKLRRNCKLAKINYSNKRTITGRIAARDGYNPQNLERESGERRDIISRFDNGNILVFDYVSFETKISLYLSEDKEYIEEYYNEDLHYETAIVLFDTPDIAGEQRNFAKILNHSLLYGAGEDTLLTKLAFYFNNPEEQLYKVRTLLKPIIDKSEEIKAQFRENEYIINPWGSIIKSNKAHASFNNYIQSFASEIVVDKLFEIRELLKPYKTELLFQVHDSLVFDLHPSESLLIDKISTILSHHKNMLFGMSYSLGPNYQDLAEVDNIISE